jgi:hypothetical protein
MKNKKLVFSVVTFSIAVAIVLLFIALGGSTTNKSTSQKTLVDSSEKQISHVSFPPVHLVDEKVNTPILVSSPGKYKIYVYLVGEKVEQSIKEPRQYLFSYEVPELGESTPTSDILNYIYNDSKSILYIAISVGGYGNTPLENYVYQVKLAEKDHTVVYSLAAPKPVYVDKVLEDKYLTLKKASCYACEAGIESSIILNLDKKNSFEIPYGTDFQLSRDLTFLTYKKYEYKYVPCNDDDRKQELCFVDGTKRTRELSSTSSKILLP